MPVNAPGVVFSLIREDPMSVTETLDYTDGAGGVPPTARYHDEIRLLSPNGEPCAIPVSQDNEDLDERHRYINGDIGHVARRMKHRILLNIDYIDGKLRRKLTRWMHDRARVLFTPGFGDNTEMAWRMPAKAYGSITPKRDLTDRWTWIPASDAARSNTWDELLGHGFMQHDRSGSLRYIKTPGGTGPVIERIYENIFDPASPTGATVGTCGWTASGASLSLSFKSHGFGYNPSCEGSVRVQGSASSDYRALHRALDADIPGSAPYVGNISVTVWLRGNIGTGGFIQLGSSGGTKQVDLSGYDLSEWTPCRVQYYASHASNILLSVFCGGADSSTDICDFEVGPTVVTYNSGLTTQAWNNWQTHGAARTVDTIYITNFTYPRNGSLLVSFWIPEDFDPEGDFHWIYWVYQGANAGALISGFNSGDSGTAAVWYWNVNPYVSTPDAGFIPGAVNTLGVTWTADTKKLYVNGALVDTDTSDSMQAILSQTGTLNLFGLNNYGTWPLIPLAARLDNEVFDDDLMMDLHGSMANPGALEVTVPARGRIYRIRSVPSTPRSANGTTHWLGQLELEQVDYDPYWVDETCKELAP